MSRSCARPDRDEPRIKCGYPLPCPHHTVVVDKSGALVPPAVQAEPRAFLAAVLGGLVAGAAYSALGGTPPDAEAFPAKKRTRKKKRGGSR